MIKGYTLWLVSLFLLPFFQGGYYDHQVLLFGLIQAGIFLRNYKRLGNAIFDIKKSYLIGILFALFVSFFFALDQSKHWIGILRFSVSFLFFLILSHCFEQNPIKVKKDLMKVVVSGAFLMSFSVIWGMLLFQEHSIGGFFVQRGRIGGFFQYANSFAAYLFGAQLLLLHQMEREKKFHFIDLGLVVVIQIGIALTQSRALILINVIFLFLSAIWLLRAALASFMGLLIGQGILTFFISNSNPQRALQISVSSSEWLSRLLYYEDGLHMIWVRPFGYGHLGYYYAQRYYQSGASYHVKFIHNGALQLALDFGLPLLLLLVYFFFKVLRKGINDWQGKKILILGTIGFFGHCLVDINLQF
ncbi:MAG: O-antigen ligase family protein, partial [Vallitaleaceae bacterium]|nr:O-antigen ligase family protein [Vallitaleaceae bacterium]